MNGKKLADVLVSVSVLAVIFAIVGSLGYDLWLASTQWLIVAIVLTAYASYLRER